MYNIIEVLDETTLWPGRKGYNVKVLENDVEYVTKLEKEVVDVILHINKLRAEAKIYLSDVEMDELWDKINEMARASYWHGYDDNYNSY